MIPLDSYEEDFQEPETFEDIEEVFEEKPLAVDRPRLVTESEIVRQLSACEQIPDFPLVWKECQRLIKKKKIERTDAAQAIALACFEDPKKPVKAAHRALNRLVNDRRNVFGDGRAHDLGEIGYDSDGRRVLTTPFKETLEGPKERKIPARFFAEPRFVRVMALAEKKEDWQVIADAEGITTRALRLWVEKLTEKGRQPDLFDDEVPE